ncbi:ferredoxin-thioredoxin reductase catalytic domain-containing protein [Coprococcus ammoniilyticus]|uniref:ferredoxin-thioredoxin reductase catalytic domain-containing protein n=1 Tax=Coprococcus ammoniilyticus TaxID=2981785 RepID=UPI003A8A5611
MLLSRNIQLYIVPTCPCGLQQADLNAQYICHCTIFVCSRITRSASEHTLYTWHCLLR